MSSNKGNLYSISDSSSTSFFLLCIPGYMGEEGGRVEEGAKQKGVIRDHTTPRSKDLSIHLQVLPIHACSSVLWDSEFFCSFVTEAI
jgi:hypothetical protein